VPPFRDDKQTPFQFPNWTRLVWNAKLARWTSEETVYNPARGTPAVRTRSDSHGGKTRSAL